MNRDPLAATPIEMERYEFTEEPRYLFEVDRREFLKLFGGGIAVFLVMGESLAQRQGPGGGNQPQDLGAWLHISEEGQITAFTGKVEVGQNARTSLSQSVAEELHVAPTSIRLVMGDTDLVPFDGGTFGSGTSPRMVPQMRRVGAVAREMLLDLAGERTKTERARLVVADGKVTDPESKQSFTFGELTKGKKLAKAIAANPNLTPAADWKVLGTSVPKIDARAIVTGQHRYSSDMKLPGMLYGKVLRPETLEAKLTSADLEAARAMPGVTAVRDGNFVGVAAPSVAKAEEALTAIKAVWDSPPQASMKDLFADLKKTRGGGGGGGGGGFGGRGGGNSGSIEKGMDAADHKLEVSYTIAYIAHAPLEPRAALAEWKDGKLTVWTGTQGPFRVRQQLAQAFGIAQDKVRVIMPDTGSGYGGKHSGEAAVEAARLAKAAGKPVKLVWTREEEFTWAYFRPAGVIDVKAGVSKDGLLTAWEFHNYNSGGSAIQTPYAVPNQRCEAHNAQSPLRQGSYRALAATANHFARESSIDELAHAVSMDPLEFRLKNLKDERVRAVLEAAAKAFGWGRAKAADGHGFGLAAGTEKNSVVATCAEVSVDKGTGQVRVLRAVTAFECGAIINPDHLKNQVEGAVIMGLGGALFEAIEFEKGKILNAAFSKYRVPRFRDLPVLETVLLDRRDKPPIGAGETPIVGIAPAVGNAIFQATGVRVRSMPMVPKGLKV